MTSPRVSPPRIRRVLHIGMDGMNLPLLRMFAAEGVLPTFSALMARGSVNRVLPAIPAWTPTNWATMVTGATAGTHGLGGWSVRRRSDPWSEQRLDSWHSDAMTAETIWEVADQAGLKTLVNFWPSGSWPSRLTHGYVVASGFHDSPFPMAAPVCFHCTTRADVAEGRSAGVRQGGRSGSTVDTAETGIVPGSVVCRLASASTTGGTDGDTFGANLTIPLLRGGESTLHVRAKRGPTGTLEHVAVYQQPDDAEPLLKLHQGEWSDFVTRDWGAGSGLDGNTLGTVRFHLLATDAESVSVVSSQVYAARGWAAPQGLDQQLIEAAGPFFDTFSIDPTGGDAELRCFLQDIEYQGEWQVRVAKHLMASGGWDLHFSHWHLFDHINHPTVNPADPDGPNYDPTVGAWMMEAQRQTYIAGDRVLKQFLELADEETLVCVLSDHAMPPAHRWGHPLVRLEEAGLLVRGANGKIDLERSQVYVLPDRGSEVYVSLRGREPWGSVPPDRLDAVKNAVIDALLDWRDSLDNKRVVALALKLEDAAMIGFWGDPQTAACGDVVFTFNRGFGWGPPVEGGSVGAGKGAQHGSQLPTTETKYFTNMATLIAAGPGIRAGYERDWHRHGLMRMEDFAPTIAHALGLRPPRQSRGAVLHDLWEE
ncbi:MAG TPA: alkaline phosphatase family protein [Chloroflexota bacterium]|nr:alkaline phosphatase family protein [Chloroflexota bacterium]